VPLPIRIQCRRVTFATKHALSPAALQSQWVRREWYAALDLEDAGQLHVIVPVLAEPCEIISHPAEDLSFQRFVSELQGNAFRFVQSKCQWCRG
jgi:hypothetical protein